MRGCVANNVCVIAKQRRTLCFWNCIIGGDNAHSFACVLLFPKSTKVSFGAPWVSQKRSSTLNDLLQATMLRIRATNRTIVGYVRCARFPQMQALASLFTCGPRVAVQDVNGRDVNGAAHGAHCTFEITLLQAIMLTLLFVCSFSPKVQSILRGFYNMVPFRTSYASFLTSQSSQATIACLMLAYSFSPKVQSIFWGPHNGRCFAMTEYFVRNK